MATLTTYIKLAVQLAQSRLITRMLGPHVDAILVETPFGKLAIDPADRGVGRQLLIHGCYAADETERLFARVPSGGDALIVGAHIGALAIALATKAKSVVAIEPNPRSYGLLQTSLTLNDIKNVELLNAAASDDDGSIEMLLSTANSGGSKRIPRKLRMLYEYDAPERISVPAVRLDGIFLGRRFDLVVMDIEGSEYFALLGMQGILASASHLAIEFLPHHLRDVSEVTVGQFLEPIASHFMNLFVPSKNIVVPREQFLRVLVEMYEQDAGDDGLIFSK